MSAIEQNSKANKKTWLASKHLIWFQPSQEFDIVAGLLIGEIKKYCLLQYVVKRIRH